LVHFIGKDNIVFHAVIFPIILKDHGDLILPDNVPAYEFLNLEGDKFSTSRNWAVWLHEYLERHPGKEDELKYVLTSIAPETKDSEFTWKEYQTRINSELADILGNFVNRALVLTNKYFDGIVPQKGLYTKDDERVLEEMQAIPRRISKLIYGYKLRDAQMEAMNLARLGNKYLADQEPWKLIKTNPERVQTIMNISLQISANLSIVLQPFLPSTSLKIANFLNFKVSAWDDAGKPQLQDGHLIGNPEILFQKIPDELIEGEIARLHQAQPKEILFNPQKPVVQFEDFNKLDIRLGTIIEAKKVEKADNLLELLVDTGIDKRTIVSGIAKHYKPEEIIGKTVQVLLNLEARKIRGIESHGMVLMAENSDGKLSFMSSEKEFSAGGEIR
jgi:methionyl-tRNA synthetase